MQKTTQDTINNIVWKACDTFRGTMDSSDYKDYILTMLFVKYLSDFYKEKKDRSPFGIIVVLRRNVHHEQQRREPHLRQYLY